VTGQPTAVVTGGTRGLGLALSRRLVKLDHRVVAFYRGDEAAARAAEGEFGERLRAVRVDVSRPGEVRAAVADVLAQEGAPRVVVNNAGLNVDRPVLELTDEDWQAVIGTNLSGAFYVVRGFAPAMLAAGGGVVVNVGATTGLRPRLNGANYCASKAGLLHLTKCLALELAPDIRVNSLIPGMTETDELVERFGLADPRRRAAVLAEIPQRRIASVDDIADALEFLVGDQSAYLTGQKLIADGGQFMW
jgi:acetoacetyl-CoA reductase/3-oxoacyl-[acyl-carrier protein] reductase